jgi:hypothetical protein
MCNGGETLCGALCVVTMTDVANCGACGVACLPGERCDGGKCMGTLTCPPTTMNCGNRCINTLIDLKNCGACGTACSPGQVCRLGLCGKP